MTLPALLALLLAVAYVVFIWRRFLRPKK